MMKNIFLPAVFAAAAAGPAAFGEKNYDVSLEAHCEARGLTPEREWVILVKGSLKADPRDIAGGREHIPAVKEEASKHPGSAVYVPVGIKSEFFGGPDGTRLQISFWRLINKNNKAFQGFGGRKTGLSEISAYQTLVINGIPVSARLDMPSGRMSPASSRILLGYDRLDKPALVSAPSEEDLTLERESPLVLPEGRFLFVYSDCRIKYTAEKAKK